MVGDSLMLEWWLTLYTAVLPLEICVDLWDVLLVDQPTTMLTSAAAVLGVVEDDLVKKADSSLFSDDAATVIMAINDSLQNGRLTSAAVLNKMEMVQRVMPTALHSMAAEIDDLGLPPGMFDPGRAGQ